MFRRSNFILNRLRFFTCDCNSTGTTPPVEVKVIPPYQKSEDTRIQVTVLNAASRLGQLTTFLLKNNPQISDLKIYDSQNTDQLTRELKSIPTSTSVQSYIGDNFLRRALRGSHVVLVLGDDYGEKFTTNKTVFERNEQFLRKLAEPVTEVCPDAIIAIDAPPINTTVPFFLELLKERGDLNSKRVFGVMELFLCRCNSILSRHLDVESSTLEEGGVLVIGGATTGTGVAVLSTFKPGGLPLFCKLNPALTEIGLAGYLLKVYERIPPSISGAYSLAKLVNKLADGLRGKENVRSSAFIRTSLPGGKINYLALPVIFGPEGIKQNLGLPVLSATELKLLDLVLPVIDEDVDLGEEKASQPMPETSIVPVNEKMPSVANT